jgi:hypothetical protein
VKNWLISETKKRIVRELKKILYDHPRYRQDSENVQAKFSFDQRPQRGIIVNNASADQMKLSADNFVFNLSSFVGLAPVENFPGTTVEWVRENFNVLEQYCSERSVFPSPPGVYFLSVVKVPDESNANPGEFTIDPVLTVLQEPLITFSSSADQDAQIPRDNIYPGSLQLWLENRRMLIPDVDYSVDYSTGHIVFLKPTPAGMTIFSDYRYRIGLQGPFNFWRERPDVTVLPGAVIAFGDRVQSCDKVAIVVTDTRTDVAEVYGGKFEVNFELIVFTRDTDDRDRMSDYVVVKFLELTKDLGYDGLELLNISPGGQSEEVYNQETDEYYFDTSVSLSIRVDWEIQVPIPAVVKRVELTSKSAEQEHGYLDGSFPLDLLRQGSLASVAGLKKKVLTYESGK